MYIDQVLLHAILGGLAVKLATNLLEKLLGRYLLSDPYHPCGDALHGLGINGMMSAVCVMALCVECQS